MRIGVDLGGTKTEAIVLGTDGEELIRRRVPTRRDSYEDVVSTVADLVRAVEAELGTEATVGAGTPGAISPATGLIKNANLTPLNGHPLDRDLSQALDREVRIANDADCLALSEATDGAGAGKRTVFAVIIGTGTGGGLTVDRGIVTGPNAIGGEWGHNPLPWPTAESRRTGPTATAGDGGASRRTSRAREWPPTSPRRLPWLSARRTSWPRPDPGNLALRPPSSATPTGWRADSPRSSTSIDPDVLVLAGGMSQISELYEEVPSRWAEYVFSDTRRHPAGARRPRRLEWRARRRLAVGLRAASQLSRDSLLATRFSPPTGSEEREASSE